MSILGVILARKGSKRLPGKNMKLLNGKPLIQYTIDAALQSDVIDTLVVSTDDEKIIELCEKKYFHDIIVIERPDYLATSKAPSEECLLHVMDNVEKHDYVMLLQATSPLRAKQDIIIANKHCTKVGQEPLVSVSERDCNPNGAIYMIKWDRLYNIRKLCKNYYPYVMPEKRSIDIDTELDFKIAEMLIKERDNE